MFAQNAIFDQKKAPAATGQQEENGFGHFLLKKAPAAIGQPEENGFSQKIILYHPPFLWLQKIIKKIIKNCLKTYSVFV